MARATLKVSPDTADRLRGTMPELVNAAGRILTIDQALNYLMDHWDADYERRPPVRRWGEGHAEGSGSGPA